jgi:energy-coupling factor transport system permease protein
MDEFEFLRHGTIGQYLPTGSVVHTLDPRVKLGGAFVLCVALVAAGHLPGLLLAWGALLGATTLARVSPGYAVRSVRAVWPFMLVVLALQLLAFSPGADCRPFWEWGILHISACSVHLAAVSLARFVGLILLITLLTLTTSITEVTQGAEHLLRPFSRVGLPANELALILALALRFVPLLAEEAERLMKAQAARGADFGHGRAGFVQRVGRMFPLLIPLFVASLNRTEDLALAMEARCYGGSRGRTHLVQFRTHGHDYAALVALLILSVLIIVL